MGEFEVVVVGSGVVVDEGSTVEEVVVIVDPMLVAVLLSGVVVVIRLAVALDVTTLGDCVVVRVVVEAAPDDVVDTASVAVVSV